MEISRHYFLQLVLLVCAFLLVHSQNQAGFVSLDCGLPPNTSYIDPTTGINYISDAAFIDSGVSTSVTSEYKSIYQQQSTANLRSFPQGIRNCYKLNIVKKSPKYLIRATFMYGNYDGLNKIPTFDLHYGSNFWDTVSLDKVSTVKFKEIIVIPSKDYVRVCLVNSGYGTPFISALELRPVKLNKNYGAAPFALFARFDIGSSSNQTYRYPDDVFDRIWMPYKSQNKNWTKLNTSSDVSGAYDPHPPSIVMRSAAIATNATSPMQMHWQSPYSSKGYCVYLYFAELQQLQSNDYRSFNVIIDGELLDQLVVPRYLSTLTILKQFPASHAADNYHKLSLVKVDNSTLPPVINGIEIYRLMNFSQHETYQNDVDVINKIKSTYGIDRNWDGDPCSPAKFLWEGLNCSNNGSDPPRIVSLTLSSSALTGTISPSISNLTMLQSLDLSNNNLTGAIPNFLSALPNLRVLNLKGNKLTGPLPAELVQRSRNGSLSLSVEENLNPCTSSFSCEKTKKKKKKKKSDALVPTLASIGGFIILFLIAVTIYLWKKGKQQEAENASNTPHDLLGPKKQQFTCLEISRMTNNFERVLGKGGFGTVYYGNLDNNQIAVKMLSPSSAQGYQQFQAEVKLLMTVHHKNLTRLVGYCHEGNDMVLVYEYMANGSLDTHLSGNSTAKILSWEERLEIAIDAAHGLDYLHSGCKPPIVHRDVKTSNILLAGNFQAKLADFGLSKIFPAYDDTHVTTKVAGTPGYMDPEYQITNRLNEKSDVYSFGVILLEIVTSRRAVSRDDVDEMTHVSKWVSSMLDKGDIKSITDPRLQGDFEISTVWKVVEIAMACLSPEPTKRPNMCEVVVDLKDCLTEELERKKRSCVLRNSAQVFSVNAITELNPSAR